MIAGAIAVTLSALQVTLVILAEHTPDSLLMPTSRKEGPTKNGISPS